jgi:uncharacterized protein
MFRILSIDGGGVRGLIPATILAQFEKLLQIKTNNPNVRLSHYFDLIAGTSCGSILTCLYLLPGNKYSAEDIKEIFTAKIPSVFVTTWKGLIWDGPKYNPLPLRSLTDEMVANTLLSSLTKKFVIPAYDLKKGKPHIFTHVSNHQYKIADILPGSTAAPSYFPPSTVSPVSIDGAITGPQLHLIDGGIFANNPARLALTEALKHTKLSNILMVSISCGKVADSYDPDAASKWGKLQWIIPVINIAIDGAAEIVDHSLLHEFESTNNKSNYFRFDMPLGSISSDLDDASTKNIKAMQTELELYLSLPEITNKLDNLVNKILT